MPARGWIARGTALLVGLGLTLVLGQAAVAQESASLTVYVTSCPAGYTGTDYFEDCYGNDAADVDFAASNVKSSYSESGTTDASGFVSFSLPAGLAGDLVTLSQVPPVEIEGGGDPPFVIYCTQDDGETAVDVSYSLIQLDPGGDAYSASIAVEAGADIRCDWYLLTAADNGDDDDDDGGVVTLPNTGAGTTAGAGAEGVLALLTVGGLGTAATFAARRRLARAAFHG